MSEQKTVIVLCGGTGSRVKKYFPQIIKPLFPVEGIPIIERIISMFKDYTIFINCNEEDAKQLEYLHLPLLTEKIRIGNAGAIRHFGKQLGDTFFIIHCDEFSNIDPNNVWETHMKNGKIMTMAIKNIQRKKEFGLVITTSDNLITACTKQRWVNTGMYVADKRIFDYIDPLRYQDLDKDIFPKLIEDSELYCYKFSGYWRDVGTERFLRERYEEEKKKKLQG